MGVRDNQEPTLIFKFIVERSNEECTEVFHVSKQSLIDLSIKKRPRRVLRKMKSLEMFLKIIRVMF